MVVADEYPLKYVLTSDLHRFEFRDHHRVPGGIQYSLRAFVEFVDLGSVRT